MPITFTDDELAQVERSEGGKGLRRILEEALADNRKAWETASTLQAQMVVASNGLSLVKPEELTGVPVEEIEQKARELHGQRQAEQENLARDLLARKGLEGDDLERALKDLLNPAGAESSDAARRAAAARSVAGASVPARESEGLHGVAAIAAGLSGKR